MNVVILKWNPAFSSYTMLDYLYDLREINQGQLSNFNWSVWDYEKIHAGERYFWIKVGYGAAGVVSAGTIISEPYVDHDWAEKGRTTYYVDFEPEIMINPDTLPILSNTELSQAIPEFDWFKGHSGLVLEPPMGAQIEELWQRFLARYDSYFKKALENHPIDQLYFNINDD